MKTLEAIWGSDDMFYCSVPVPAMNDHKDPDSSFDFTSAQQSNYGQSQTHPSIVYIPEGWNGHKYWMATTPYPQSMGVFENPCIYYGDEDSDGNPPKVFIPISGTASGDYIITDNPIVKVPSNTTTNSDPDLYYDAASGIMYLYSRLNSASPMRGYIQASADGQAWTKRDAESYMDMNYQPSILKVDENVLIFGLSPAQNKYNPDGGYPTGGSRPIFNLWKGDITDVESFVRDGYACFGGKQSIGAYHADFFKDDATGKYYMIAACTNHELPSPYNVNWLFYVYLAESTDGYNYHMFARPLLGRCSKCSNYYRPTAFIRQSDRKLVVYWCTTEGIIKTADQYPNGASDIPVDDRTIGVSWGNFDGILSTLKSDEVTNMLT